MNHAPLLPLLALALTACAESSVDAAERPPAGKPGTLPLAEIQQSVKDPTRHVAFAPESPLGLARDLAARIPADNPMTHAKVELGRELFFDPRLSKDGTLACATCHHPSMGWAENQPVSTGVAGRKGARNAPTIVNRILGSTQFRDGRARSLEEQAVSEIGDPLALDSSPAEAATRLNSIEGYRVQFEAVFGGPANPERVAKAVAAFERTILSGENELDLYERAQPFMDYEPDDGDDAAFLERMQAVLAAEEQNRLSESAERGRALFFDKARCSTCHVGQDLSDEQFHDLGVGMAAKAPDLGRYLVTQLEKDKGAFRTPSLRDVALTAPYMHDGSLKTLREVVEYHAKGGTPNPWLSDKLAPLALSEQDVQDLVTFLEEGLSGKTTPVEIPRLP